MTKLSFTLESAAKESKEVVLSSIQQLRHSHHDHELGESMPRYLRIQRYLGFCQE